MVGAMDVIHNLLNVIFLVFSIIMFIFLLPALWLFNILRFYFKSMYPEELAGKVILITGASAGIGEHLAMEYAKEGACLALVARREKELEIVAQNAKAMGSPNVIAISADVSKLHDCNRFVDQTIKHFGKLDYLIINAAIVTFGFFEDQTCVPDDHASIMNVNFWGSVFTIHFALPHLQRNQGKIIAICSCGDWFGTPRVSVYNASKAALRSFLETLKMELGSKTEITIVTPGLVNTRLIDHEWVKKGNAKWIPMISVERCAKAIVDSTKRGDKYLTEPVWMKTLFLWKTFCPDIHNIIIKFVFMTWPKISSNKI